MICAFSFMQDGETQRIVVLSESVQHWLPQVSQYILKSGIGHLSYPVEPEESRFELAALQVKKHISLIDSDKQEMLYRSFSADSPTSSPKREKFFMSRKYTGLLSRDDSEVMRSISNAEEVYLE